ncbi:MAG: response regulator transcription factor [Luteolibacter sp.]
MYSEILELGQGAEPQAIVMAVSLPATNGTAGLQPARLVMLPIPLDLEALTKALATEGKGRVLRSRAAEALASAVQEAWEGAIPIGPLPVSRTIDVPKSKATLSPTLDRLSQRQLEVLELLAQGLTYKEVAQALSLSFSTVHRHVECLYTKLGVHSRTQAVVKFMEARKSS